MNIGRFRPRNLSPNSWLIGFIVLLIASVSTHAANERTLGSGDVVELRVFQQPDMNIMTRLGAKGTMKVPLLGNVELANLSVRQAEDLIASRLRGEQLVVNPHVSLFIREYLSHQVSVIGHVNSPGRYSFERGDSMVDAIALAGGFSTNAGDRAILIRRGKETEVQTEINFENVMSAGDSRNIAPLEDGDVVFIPRQEVFYVFGEAQRPGVYRLDHNMTVMQGLAVAGSLTDKGSIRGIRIRRRNDKGDLEGTKVDLTGMLQANDVIQVKESIF